mgnify:CR=1 FL=1
MFTSIRRAKRAGKSQNQTPRNQIGPAARGLKRRDAGIRGKSIKIQNQMGGSERGSKPRRQILGNSIKSRNQMGGSYEGLESIYYLDPRIHSIKNVGGIHYVQHCTYFWGPRISKLSELLATTTFRILTFPKPKP